MKNARRARKKKARAVKERIAKTIKPVASLSHWGVSKNI
jgi:hypothetical protein